MDGTDVGFLVDFPCARNPSLHFFRGNFGPHFR